MDPPVPSYEEVEHRAQEGQEDDDQDPHDLVVPLKLVHQHADQGQQGKEDHKENDEKGQQKTGSEKEKKSHGNWLRDTS